MTTQTTPQHPRYLFDRWLAAGGMGEVWQATDTLLDREVAVKVLRRDLAQDTVLRSRFAAEARHAGALQHPHVASVLDYGELDDQGPTPLPFLVMELVEGRPLSTVLAQQPLAAETAAELIAQAAEGIEAAHAIGIVHRDVKPGNLLVTPEGQVKVTDFGVARAVDAASLTVTGYLIGTPHYLSPEQAEGGTATAVSDVYSLGIVLYECLTGSKPFAAETPVATAVMQIREPLPALPDSVPERLQRITRIATAKDPEARFRSAGAMAAALRDDSADTRSYPIAEAGRATAATGPSTSPTDPAAVGAVPPGRRGRRVLTGFAILLLLSGGAWATTALEEEPLGAPPADAAAPEAAVGIRVRARDFLGDDREDAVRRLERLGLPTRTEGRANPGDHDAGTVAAVSPTGLVDPGTLVTLTVWSPPPAPPAPTADIVEGSDDAGSRSGGAGRDSKPASPARDRSRDRPPKTAGTSPAAAPGKAPGKGPGNSQGRANDNAGKGNSNAGGKGRGNGRNGGAAKPGKGGKR